MAEKFLMPKLSPTMEEGQISRWLKAEGDTFEANETIAEVDTDKATMEMTALTGGTLLKIIKDAGDTALLGEAIAITGEKGEDISALLSEVSSNGAGKVESQESRVESEEKKVSIQDTNATNNEQRTTDENQQSEIRNPKSKIERMIVSPIAARMAAENGVDLKSINGSGPNGRIIKRDIESAIESRVESRESKVQPLHLRKLSVRPRIVRKILQKCGRLSPSVWANQSDRFRRFI